MLAILFEGVNITFCNRNSDLPTVAASKHISATSMSTVTLRIVNVVEGDL